jgi:ribonuclease HIII
MPELSSYTCKLDAGKVAQLKRDLEARGFVFRDVPYAHFGAEHRGEKVSVAMYQSGKFVIQGKGTTDFIQFYLEPVLLGEVKLGYEEILDPTLLEPRIGVDESGKGDFFGPLVVAGVFVNTEAIPALQELGVKDSKAISSDKRIFELAKGIRGTRGCLFNAKMGNVNSLLGWGHARVIENLLSRVPDCKKAISDQFGNKRIIEKALMERGKKIQLVQRHKAESDVAVAAASILARDEFVRRLIALGRATGVTLPKGASEAVVAAGVDYVKKHGREALGKVAKLHFRTSQKVFQEAGA